jgi:putative transposase
MRKHETLAVLKLALEPDIASTETLDGQSRICNWAYNHLLDEAHAMRKQYIETQQPELAKIVYTERGLRNLLPALKDQKPFLKTVHSSVLKNTALRLSASIQAHQKSKKGKRKGKPVGWPKHRSWKAAWFSLYYDEPDKGFKVIEDQLVLSLGTGQDRKRRSISIPLKDSHLLKGKDIRNLRIVKQLGQFFAIFTICKSLPIPKPIERVIALDPNHKNLSYGVDTQGNAIEIETALWLKKYDKRIDELKGKRDRCQKKSHNIEVLDEEGKPTGKTYWKASKRWIKYHQTLQRVLQKRRDQTKTFLYSAAHQLFKNYDCVGMGDYAPNGEGLTTKMRRAMNNRSLIDRFKQTLAWVATKSGKVFLEYEEKGTTRTCHICHFIVESGIDPSIREWNCPTCKTIHHRDENAAKNGLCIVLRNLAEKSGNKIPLVSGSDLVAGMQRWAWRVLPSGVRCNLRGQNSVLIAAPGN